MVAGTRSSFRDFFPTKGYEALCFKKLREADRVRRMPASNVMLGADDLGHKSLVDLEERCP